MEALWPRVIRTIGVLLALWWQSASHPLTGWNLLLTGIVFVSLDFIFALFERRPKQAR